MERFIDSQRHKFVVKDEKILGTILRQVEEEWRCETQEDGGEEMLWLHLLEFAVTISNTQLCLLLAGRLDISQLALILRGTIQSKDKIKQLIAINYLAEQVGVKSKSSEQMLESLPGTNDQPSIYELKQLIDYLIDCGRWDDAFRLIDHQTVNARQRQSLNKMLVFNLSQSQEDSDNFEDSLNTSLALCSTYRHCKLLFKHHERSGYSQVKQFLVARGSSSIYSDMSLAAGDFEDLLGHTSSEKANSAQEYRRFLEIFVLKSLPSKIRDFVEESDGRRWADKRRIEFMKSQVSSLDPDFRCKLFELAQQYELSGKLAAATALYLCLDCQYKANQLFPGHLGCSRSLEMSCELSEPQTMSNLRRVFCEDSLLGKRMEKSRCLFGLCIKQGLVDEALQFLLESNFDSETQVLEGAKTLEEMAQDDGLLEQVDPEISEATLSKLASWPSIDENLSTHVITIVILSMTILLRKLDVNNSSRVEVASSRLEVMFQGLGDLLEGKGFVAATKLIEAAQGLISAIKGKLEALCESEPIRRGFKGLVEATAGRCMMEGRHRSAAQLYNQIEDHVNSVKCLMRTGEVEVVINYSLLVRDATVNRITINYLRHLGADSATMESFISRSRA